MPQIFKIQIQGHSRSFKDIFSFFQGHRATKFKDIQGQNNNFPPFSRNSRMWNCTKIGQTDFLNCTYLITQNNTPHWSRFQKSSHTLRFSQILSAILFKSAIFLLLHILTATGIIFSHQLFEMCWFFHWKTKTKDVSFFEGVVSNANETYRKTPQA